MFCANRAIIFRQDYDPSPLNTVMYIATSEVDGFVMEPKTLLGIRQRAEAAAKGHMERGRMEQ